MKPTGATKDDEQRFVAIPPNTQMSAIGEMRQLAANWNDKSRIEQVTARHRMHDISGIPNSEYTASWSDVALLIKERERLREALRRLRDSSNQHTCNGGGSNCDRCSALELADAALNDATPGTSAGGG